MTCKKQVFSCILLEIIKIMYYFTHNIYFTEGVNQYE